MPITRTINDEHVVEFHIDTPFDIAPDATSSSYARRGKLVRKTPKKTWGWECGCGALSGGYSNLDEAMTDARVMTRHLEAS